MNNIILRIGERIRQLRKQQDISQDILAERSGLHNNYIGQVERGEKNITIESLNKIATGLSVSFEELFYCIDPTHQPDEIRQLVEILYSRPKEDHVMVLTLVKNIIEWENNKR
ncbi:transcriptional regulator [Paenibacillus sp. KS1]|uniref:helix-turn-helix domain-containing protein n=1 Tax=Paenibacillus sp. KS1 TaxID=1849249 RepID=UPI0008066D77|nr:helix-turn-helix transcriptional regulator [Paenibacillus sp. KS1]OBY80371.1 transcriptional regulator [Paenibacillus sp. KS1]